MGQGLPFLPAAVDPFEMPELVGQERANAMLASPPVSQGALEAYLMGQPVGRGAPMISEAGGAPQLIPGATPKLSYTLPSQLETQRSQSLDDQAMEDLRKSGLPDSLVNQYEEDFRQRRNENPFVGFATGGSFTVQGNGGTDSELVAFKATPGEQVSIQRPQLGSGVRTLGGMTSGEWGGNRTAGPQAASWVPRAGTGGMYDKMANPNQAPPAPGMFPEGDPGFRQGQHTLRELLTAQAQGEGPSLAQQQFNNAKDALTRQQMALAAGNRSNPAMAARQASINAGNMGAQLAGQAAAARLDERQRAQGLLSNLLGQARGQDLNVANTNLAAMFQQQGLNLQAIQQMQAAEDARLAAILGQPPPQNAFDRTAQLGTSALQTYGAMHTPTGT